MDSDYIFVEVHFYSLSLDIEEFIFGLDSLGKKAVIAHPGRNREFQSTPKRKLELVSMCVLVQVTASSLSGGFGDAT